MKTHGVDILRRFRVKATYYNAVVAVFLPITMGFACNSAHVSQKRPADLETAQVCDAMAVFGLNLDILFAPGASQLAKIKVSGEGMSSESEVTPDTAMVGVRIFGADGRIRPWYAASVPALGEKTGTFSVTVESNGKSLTKDGLVIAKRPDGCHVVPVNVPFEVTSASDLQLDDAKDYYPLGKGDLVEVDKKTGVGRILGKAGWYKDFEWVRVLLYQTTSGEGPSATMSTSLREEKVVSGKSRLGDFRTKGENPMPLPAGAVQDSGSRVLFATSFTPDVPAELAALKADIDSMIANPLCEVDSDCQFVAFGAKPCGGPRSYLYYSKKTLDENALKSKVGDYYELDKKNNAATGVISTCDFIEPLTPRCVAIGSSKVCRGQP